MRGEIENLHEELLRILRQFELKSGMTLNEISLHRSSVLDDGGKLWAVSTAMRLNSKWDKLKESE